MNQYLKLIIPVILLLVLLTQCDSVSPESAHPEPETDIKTKLKSPSNTVTNQSIQVQLEWNRIKGARNYELMISESFETLVTDTTVSGNSYKTKNLSENTTYYWKVFPLKKRNSGPWSDTWSFTTGGADVEVTDEITLISPEDNADKVSTNLEFSWKNLANTSEYVYQLSDNSTFNSLIHEADVEGTSYKPDVLVHQKKYFWRVKGAGDSEEWSEVRAFTTGFPEDDEDGEADLSAVTLASPEDGAEDRSLAPVMTWEELDEADQYQIMIDVSNSFVEPVIDEVEENSSLEVPELEPETTYYWGVRALADGEAGPWSDTWSFTTDSEGTIEMRRVTLSSPSDEAGDQPSNLTLEWNTVSGAENYRIMVDESNAFNNSIIDETVTEASFEASGLEPGTTYYWGVRAQNGDDIGEWSQTWSLTTEISNIAQPDLSSPSNGATNQSTSLTLSWQNVQSVNEYQVQLATNSSFSNIAEDEVVFNTSFDVFGLNNNQTYYWRVRGVTGNETGPWSSTQEFTTEGSFTPPPSSGDFVSTNNGNFVLDGQTFRFAGTNAYYLPNYEKIDPGVVNRALDLFEDTGVNVVRMWGFYDGFDCGYSQYDSTENVIQTAPGEYNEQALRDLDNVIAKGKERGIKFIIPFVNYWDELGGICQYNTWAGASNPSTNMDFFINNSDTQRWFRDYIEMLLNRVNTVTGVAYKDEPAIFAWQIMNEGRNPGQHYSELRDWYREMAQFIKSIDSNHMVSTGEEGYDEGTPSEYTTGEYSNTYVLRANEGTSYLANTAIPEIDFGSAHWYPSEWGFGTTVNDDMLRAQRAWLNDHQRIAESYGKPFYIGEFGFPGFGDERVDDMYNAFYQHAESIQLDGSLLWQLVADGTKCWEFGGNICYPGGREDVNLYNSFRQHVDNMSGLK